MNSLFIQAIFSFIFVSTLFGFFLWFWIHRLRLSLEYHCCYSCSLLHFSFAEAIKYSIDDNQNNHDDRDDDDHFDSSLQSVVV